jgi:TonB-dependent SusC/RagA subfamily outer membrane receptor
LKDATAAAIYGARGGTGVIVITSKRGKAGKNVVTYKTQYGVTQRPSFARMNLMSTREMLAYEEREKIAKAGYERSKKDHTYFERTKNLIEIIKNNKNENENI